MYTADQLKRVVEWLGIEPGVDRFITYPAESCRTWLLSPEGRCAIEDKFIEAEQYMYVDIDHDYPTPPRAPKTYAVFGSADYDDERWGRGDTIAEAWLDTAVKYTEEK